MFRHSVFGRLAGYEDVNDAERLGRDPAMRAIVSREGLRRAEAYSSQIGRFETEPGHQMQGDWATVGRGVDVLKVFIATLGWSRASYVEFCDDERVETLIGCHERALLAFGGVPKGGAVRQSMDTSRRKVIVWCRLRAMHESIPPLLERLGSWP